MLTIRAEQLEPFVVDARERFIERILRSLPTVFPSDSRLERPDELRALVDAGLERAAGWGLGMERELMLYVYLFIEYGAGFEKREPTAWMGRLLARSDLEGGERLDIIYKRLELTEEQEA